jgi:thiosulfate/3-mercaptopyruvate sulfurtransferase
MRFAKLFVVMAAVSAAGWAQSAPVFVSPDWLSGHLGDPNLVILHVAFSRSEFKAGHIPGARFLWYDWLAVSTPDASTEIPPAAQADTVLGGLGITDSSRIIVCYSGTTITPAARVFLTLTYFGLGGRTSLLDGGLEAWKVARLPIAQDLPTSARTHLTLRTSPSVIVDAEQVRAALHDPRVVIVDARDVRFFNGMGGGLGRTGHIQGAKSIPFSAVVDSTTRTKDPAQLRKIFSEAGVSAGTKVYVYCHVGQQASLVFAVAHELGIEAAVYDGSFQDWSVRGEDYPVEKQDKQAR